MTGTWLRALLTPTSTAFLAAAIISLVDATLVVFGLAGAGGAFQFVPARIWIVAPLTWIVLAVLTLPLARVLSRRYAGETTAAALALALLTVRLRHHPLVLAAAIPLAALATWLLWRPVHRWRPRVQPVATGVLLVALVLGGLAAFRRPADVRADARATAEDPNVILIFLDTVRYDAVFDGDGDVHPDLPTLARLRRGSTVFTRAYATSPWTLPSHLSAVTGLPPHELGVGFDSQVYGGSQETLAERYRRRGYRTAAVISNTFLNAGSGFARGFEHFEQAQFALDLCRTAPGVVLESYSDWFAATVCNWSAGTVTARAMTLMADDDRPLFLTLNYMDAHDPYYVERACGGGRGYREAIRCIDRHLASIVDRPSRRPTTVAIVSDHGEQFGEHGLVRHGNSLAVQLLHVPLMIRWAQDGPHPRVVTQAVSITALPGLLERGDAASLPEGPAVALLYPPAAQRMPASWAALDGVWQLIVREDGAESLFHLREDPAGERDVIAAHGTSPAVARLRSAIDAMRRAPRPDVRRFRSLGYIH
ncbi:MAG TPA: sulfatase [Vicinamibacterales bacterium]|nr:sulfatase [Vicinamibacterales bacterium]